MTEAESLKLAEQLQKEEEEMLAQEQAEAERVKKDAEYAERLARQQDSGSPGAPIGRINIEEEIAAARNWQQQTGTYTGEVGLPQLSEGSVSYDDQPQNMYDQDFDSNAFSAHKVDIEDIMVQERAAIE